MADSVIRIRVSPEFKKEWKIFSASRGEDMSKTGFQAMIEFKARKES